MLKRLKGSRPVQVIQAYGKAQGSNYASGLAFTAFLAMFPLILGMLAIVGLVGSIATVIVYSCQKNEGFYIPAATVAAIEEKRSGAGAPVALEVD